MKDTVAYYVFENKLINLHKEKEMVWSINPNISDLKNNVETMHI